MIPGHLGHHRNLEGRYANTAVPVLSTCWTVLMRHVPICASKGFKYAMFCQWAFYRISAPNIISFFGVISIMLSSPDNTPQKVYFSALILAHLGPLYLHKTLMIAVELVWFHQH